MNAHKFVAEHGVEQAKSILEKAPETATHFTEALGGHYAKEVILKMKPQWAWFNTINKEWYYDFAAKEHIELAELKQVVESVDLVKRYGGVEAIENLFHVNCDGQAKIMCVSYLTWHDAKQAIKDVELIEQALAGEKHE